jgi:hypothetical protein
MIYPRIHPRIALFNFPRPEDEWLKKLSLFLGLKYKISYINFQGKEREKIAFAIITKKHKFFHRQIDVIMYDPGDIRAHADGNEFNLYNTSESIEKLIKTINDNL